MVCQIVAIDPENELEEMARTFGGDIIDIGKGGEFGMINPLEVVIDADDEEIASRTWLYCFDKNIAIP